MFIKNDQRKRREFSKQKLKTKNSQRSIFYKTLEINIPLTFVPVKIGKTRHNSSFS